MSKPTSSRARKQAAAKRARRQQQSRFGWIVGAVAVVIVLALVIALAAGGGSKKNTGPDRLPASPALVTKTTSVPQSVFDTVGPGTSTANTPQVVNGSPLTANGKPLVLYIGAEYCPYCATERWPMVVALSKFGTFASLKTTTSASDDVYADTPTWSFYQSTYSSPYLTFQSVETETRTRQPLEQPTAEQLAVQRQYDPKLTIPFLQLGGKYLISGATYDPGVLQNKTHDEIASALSDPSSDVAKGVIGTANTLIAAICNLTKNQPANVCTQPAITSIAATLK